MEARSENNSCHITKVGYTTQFRRELSPARIRGNQRHAAQIIPVSFPIFPLPDDCSRVQSHATLAANKA